MHRETIETPQISVVMSIYNEPEEWLKASIESILNQTFTDFEFIIINDNPERELNNNLLNEYQKKDNRIVIIKNEENIGLTRSLNKGLKTAKGKYIARMDGDDISLPERLEKQYKFLEKNESIIALGTWVVYFGGSTKLGNAYRINPAEVNNYFLIGTPVAHPTAIFRRIIIEENQIQYDEKYVFSQDYKFWYQISQIGNISNIPEYLLKYRVTENQISTKNKEKQHELAASLRRKILLKIISEHNVQIKEESLCSLNTIKYINSFNAKNSENSSIPVVLYALIMSLKEKKERIIAFFYLIIHPFMKVGFNKRYYAKALVKQIWPSRFENII